MSYRFALSKSATRYTDQLSARSRSRVFQQLKELCSEPYSRGSHPLHGKLTGARTCRLGNLRVLYEIDVDAQLIRVLSIGPRGDIYKGR